METLGSFPNWSYWIASSKPCDPPGPCIHRKNPERRLAENADTYLATVRMSEMLGFILKLLELYV